MKIAVFFLSFSVLLLGTVSSGYDGDERISYREAVEFRMRAVEEHLGVQFEPGWFPGIFFSLPEYYDTSANSRKTVFAHYSVDVEAIFLNPEYFDSTRPLFKKDFLKTGSVYGEDTSWSAIVRTTLDHELGHALADGLSRRMGLGPWPPLRKDRECWDGWQIVGNDILMEGVGEFFGNLSVGKKDVSLSFLPDTLPHFGWWLVLRGLLAYSGGYAMVSPILEEFGGAGLVYIIRNRLVVENKLLRRSAEKYQERAFEVLEYAR